VLSRSEIKKRIVTTVVILSLSLFLFSSDLAARERRGAELVIQKQDGGQMGGELIAVKQNSLLLLDAISNTDVSVAIGDVAIIKIFKKSKALIGAVFGLLAGAGVGAISASVHGGNQEEDPWAEFWGGMYRTSILVLFISAGTVIGLAAGAALGKDETIEFQGKSPEEIKSILVKLRKQARIPNFQ
jgi:hypothetical protein